MRSKYNIEWYCLSDLKGMKNSPLAKAYNLNSSSFVVDPEGADCVSRTRGMRYWRHYLHCVINGINHV